MAARKNSKNKPGYMKSTLGGVLCSAVLSSPATAIAAEDDIVLIQGFTIGSSGNRVGRLAYGA